MFEAVRAEVALGTASLAQAALRFHGDVSSLSRACIVCPWGFENVRMKKRRGNGQFIDSTSNYESLTRFQVKHQLGKLELDVPLSQIVRDQTVSENFSVLSIDAKHVLALGGLPLHHNDPFDRLLIAQAQTEGARPVSADSRALRDYAADVQLLW